MTWLSAKLRVVSYYVSTILRIDVIIFTLIVDHISWCILHEIGTRLRESIFVETKQMSHNGLYKNRKVFDIDFYYFVPILLLYPSTPVEDLFHFRFESKRCGREKWAITQAESEGKD
jgi:hypothetical protein